jgi:hypothetical protein
MRDHDPNVRSQAHDAKNDRSTPVPLCARSDARDFRAFRAESPVRCTPTENGHSSTLENGSVIPVMRLDRPGLST